MRRRRALWLLLAAALFGVASWLMWRGERRDRPLPPRHAERDFPRYSRPEETQREARRVVALPASSAQAKPAAPRDPLLAALPPGARTTVVLEAGAIRDSPLGRLLLRCAFRDGGDRLEELKSKHGFDPVNAIDRVAITDDAEIVTGAFGGVDWAGVLGSEGGLSSRAYGTSGTIYDVGADGGSASSLATWGDGMLLVGPSAEALQRAIDRVEGRAAQTQPPPIGEGDAYGEAYGVVSPDSLAGLLPDELDAKLRATAQRIGLHVDARDAHDVLMVADVDGTDGAGVDDLGRSLGAAMAVGRVKARADDDQDMLELLGVSRVVPHDGTFRVEVALPLEFLERKMCRDAGR